MEQERRRRGKRWVVSSPHTGVLTCTVGKQRRARLSGVPDRCLLEDLAFLFVLLQSPAAGNTAVGLVKQIHTKKRGGLGFKSAVWSNGHEVAAGCLFFVHKPHLALSVIRSGAALQVLHSKRTTNNTKPRILYTYFRM